MKNKNRHIDKYLHDRLPEPEVPADDAWGEMNDMLNTVPVKNIQAGKAAKVVANLMKFKWVIGTLLAVTSLSLLIISKQDVSVSIKDSPRHSTQAVTPSDSFQTDNQTPHAVLPADKSAPLNVEIPITDSLHSKSPALSDVLASSDTPALTERTETAIATTQGRNSKQHVITSKSPENNVNQTKRKAKPKGTKLIVQPKTNFDLPLSSTSDSPRSNTPDQLTDHRATSTKNKTFNAPISSLVPNEISNKPAARFPIQSLKSLQMHFPVYNPDLKNKIVSQNFFKQPGETANKKNGRNRTLHAGLEWNFNMSFKGKDYLFTGADSIQGFPKVLIPGIFIAKSWQKHTVTVSFLPYQSYFGDHAKISHEIDSTISTDSSKFYNNKRFIKAIGTTFNLQYQYQISSLFALDAGVSYHAFSGALIRQETENYRGDIMPGQLVTLKKSDSLSTNINPRLFTLKAGILFTPGRFQAGLNVILPLSNISKSSQPVRALNGQVFLRYLVW